MSGTDKTRPWTVKCLDDSSWLVENHDHTTGACDLPPRPEKTANPFGATDTSCTWRASAEFWHLRANGCGCPRCTDQFARRLSVRARTGAPLVDDLADVPDLWPVTA